MLFYGSILLAHLLWFITFYLACGNFWLKIGISVLILTALSFLADRNMRERFRMDVRAVLIGLISALGLYVIFWAGREISSVIFPFAPAQIGGIYGKGAGTPPWMIFLLLMFVTGPGEEIYLRGFLQERMMVLLGNRAGWLLTSCVYATVHLWSFNFMLIGAAAVAGLFWGALYRRTRNLVPLVISHSLWSSFIFAVFPLH